MTFKARAVAPQDHGAVAQWMVTLYVEDPSPHVVTLESSLRTLRRFAAQPVRGAAVVLVRDGQDAGYALLSSFLSNELGGEICVVDELYVVPQQRGRGLAAWFIGALIARALPWFTDAVAFELEVTPDNARARALYERLGFTVKKNATLRALSAPPSRPDPS